MFNNNYSRLAGNFFVAEFLSNRVLARIATEATQSKVSPEDIIGTLSLASSVTIEYLDWEGEITSVSLKNARFDRLVERYYWGEGLEDAAQSLIKGTDYKISIEDSENVLSISICEVVLEETEAYQIPILSIEANKFAETWSVVEDLVVEKFHDKRKAIAYFKSTFFSFASQFRLGETVRYRGELWRIHRFSSDRVCLLRIEKDSTIYTSVAIDDENKIQRLEILESIPF